ncbi:GNAT family N-acetyltransferase [Nocardioides pinisoli]|uniref:GNAT family N-acetyltransferase n=1 Tax=Nocardioides pinisoli TaxID=2950279 RepID=A0ABT1KTF1_9ACTN|nr:GNAT family N-acetyltransferase [Nocardioides pinisoli]MCP3421023.1 GNAT family N-acetyltransferase [Nocardioides pinisoli]
MGELSLRPMSQDEYVAWRERSEREYAGEIATSRDLDPEAAAAASAGEFAQLLPDGLASPDMHLFTAVVDDEPVGIGWFELRQRASGVSAWIFDIRLDEDRRGQGLGRRLLDALHDAGRGLGATSMTLNVFGDNTPAIRLYESSGYAVTAQQMRKDL